MCAWHVCSCAGAGAAGGGDDDGRMVVPECVAVGADSEEHYQFVLARTRALATDRVESDRERRWRLAEEQLASSTMCSPNSGLRKRWDLVRRARLSTVTCVIADQGSQTAPPRAGLRAPLHTHNATQN